jgi:hypothetical protein
MIKEKKMKALSKSPHKRGVDKQDDVSMEVTRNLKNLIESSTTIIRRKTPHGSNSPYSRSNRKVGSLLFNRLN